MKSTNRAKRMGAAAIALAVALTLGMAPAGASAEDLEDVEGYSAAATISGPSVVVCDNEQLNLNDATGKRLSDDRIARAKAAIQYLCDQRDKVTAMATGKWVTNTTKADVKTCGCGSKYKSWWSKITATGLHTSGTKVVDLIWRIGPGNGKWNGGPVNYVGPTTTYANLPLQAGTMGMDQYVQTVGTYTRNGKIQEQIWGGA